MNYNNVHNNYNFVSEMLKEEIYVEMLNIKKLSDMHCIKILIQILTLNI